MAKTSMARRTEWWPARGVADWLQRPALDTWLEWPNFAALREGDRVLRIEEFTEGDSLVIRSEMPGIDPEKDVEIKVRDHTLEIHAERREEKSTEEGGSRRSEFRYGSFFRAVPLPTDAKDGDVQASYHDGILEVRVPCAPTMKEEPKRIPVTRT